MNEIERRELAAMRERIRAESKSLTDHIAGAEGNDQELCSTLLRAKQALVNASALLEEAVR